MYQLLPLWALPELNSNPQSLKETLLYSEPFLLVSYLECCLSSLQILTLQVHLTNYRVGDFQLSAPASHIMYIHVHVSSSFLLSLQSPPNRSDKQGYSFNTRYAAFQATQKVPCPKPFSDDSMIYSFSRKAPSRVSPLLESNTSFSFHCSLPPPEHDVKNSSLRKSTEIVKCSQ